MGKKKREFIYPFDQIQPIIETHCHLDYLDEVELAETIDFCHAQGIEKIITIAVSPTNLKRVIEISNQFKNVFCTLGVHPHEAKHYTEETTAFILKNSSLEKVLAVGEIGLDYHYNKSETSTQIEVFDKQMSMACDLDLPVVIHTREAEKDTLDILKKHAHNLKKGGVLHSFTSSMDLAKEAVDLGFHIGINGIVTFNNAGDVREIVKELPLEKLVIETDSPYLTPSPYRGIKNNPKFIPYVAKAISEIKGLDITAVCTQLYSNSKALFAL